MTDDLLCEPASRTLHLGVRALHRGLTSDDLRTHVSNSLGDQPRHARVIFYTDEDSFLAWGEKDPDATAHVQAYLPLLGDLAAWMPQIIRDLADLVKPGPDLTVMDYAVVTDSANFSAGVQVITPSQRWTYHVGPLEGDPPGTL